MTLSIWTRNAASSSRRAAACRFMTKSRVMSSSMSSMLMISESTWARMRSERPEPASSSGAGAPPSPGMPLVMIDWRDAPMSTPSRTVRCPSRASRASSMLAETWARSPGRKGGGQAWGGVHKRPAVLGDSERGDHLRDAVVVHLALGGAHAVEREPSDQARCHSSDHGAADAHVELSGKPEAAFQQALEGLR